jgi:hypothetical protein
MILKRISGLNSKQHIDKFEWGGVCMICKKPIQLQEYFSFILGVIDGGCEFTRKKIKRMSLLHAHDTCIEEKAKKELQK